jgi:hypothetical protein
MSKSKTPQEILTGELARLIAEQMSAALKSVIDSNTRGLQAVAKDLIQLIEIERAIREKREAALREELNALRKLHGLEQEREALLQ